MNVAIVSIYAHDTQGVQIQTDLTSASAIRDSLEMDSCAKVTDLSAAGYHKCVYYSIIDVN